MNNLSSRFSNGRVKSIRKYNTLDFTIPVVVYNLTNLFRSKIFDFKSFVSSIHIGKFTQKVSNLIVQDQL